MGDIKRFLLRLPPALFDTLSNEAVDGRVSLNRLIVERLSSVPGTESGKVNIGSKASGVTRAKSQGASVTRRAEGLAGSVAGHQSCASCGAMGGMHFKGCKR